jgi:hypothetical protein
MLRFIFQFRRRWTGDFHNMAVGYSGKCFTTPRVSVRGLRAGKRRLIWACVTAYKFARPMDELSTFSSTLDWVGARIVDATYRPAAVTRWCAARDRKLAAYRRNSRWKTREQKMGRRRDGNNLKLWPSHQTAFITRCTLWYDIRDASIRTGTYTTLEQLTTHVLWLGITHNSQIWHETMRYSDFVCKSKLTLNDLQKRSKRTRKYVIEFKITRVNLIKRCFLNNAKHIDEFWT